MVKDQPAGAEGASMLAVGGKVRGIALGFPQDLWMAANESIYRFRRFLNACNEA